MAINLPSGCTENREPSLFRTARVFRAEWIAHAISTLYGAVTKASIRFAFAVCSMTALPQAVTAASIPPVLEFKGTVEPSSTVIVANHITGIVADLRFAGGQDVTAGDVLALIDP